MTDNVEPPKMAVPYVFVQDGRYYMRASVDSAPMEIGEDYYNNWVQTGGQEWKQ